MCVLIVGSKRRLLERPKAKLFNNKTHKTRSPNFVVGVDPSIYDLMFTNGLNPNVNSKRINFLWTKSWKWKN